MTFVGLGLVFGHSFGRKHGAMQLQNAVAPAHYTHNDAADGGTPLDSPIRTLPTNHRDSRHNRYTIRSPEFRSESSTAKANGGDDRDTYLPPGADPEGGERRSSEFCSFVESGGVPRR